MRLRSHRLLFLLAGVLALSPVSGAAPQRGLLRDFAWDEKGASELLFKASFTAPPRPRVFDRLADKQYWHVDFYGVSGPTEMKEFAFSRPDLKLVKRIHYKDQGVLRFIFYFRAATVATVKLSGGQNEYQIAIETRPIEAPPRRPVQTGKGPRKLIVLDPGHGGHSTGAATTRPVNGRHYAEKDLVLEIAKQMVPFINDSPNLEVVFTRHDDTYVSLEDRIAIAERAKGDLFLSLHMNATDARRKDARGFEIYYLSDGKKETNRQLEDLENDKHIVLKQKASGGEDLRAILTDLADEMFARRREESYRACHAINEVFMKQGPFRAHSRGVKAAAFRVLMNYDMPAVLAELGFIDNPEDAKLVADPKNQRQIAALLFNAVSLYFASKDPEFEPHLVAVP